MKNRPDRRSFHRAAAPGLSESCSNVAGMDIVLIPGLWLNASSWDRVVPHLEAAGHRAHAVTLPGLDSPDTDRAGIEVKDHVAAAVAVLDGLPDDAEIVLVGHSMGGAVAWAAADARPARVSRVVFAASEPVSDGDSGGPPFPVEGDDVPLPDWSFFESDDEDEGDMVADLDDALRAEIRAGSVPSPVGFVKGTHRLHDERRYDLPVTMIAAEYPSDQLRKWAESGDLPELARIKDVEYVDVGGGHWPQFSQPENLASAINHALRPR